MFLQLPLEYAERQTRTVNGNVYLLEQIRHGADMILMTVRDDDALYFFLIVYEIGEIRHDEVYAEHIIVGKAYTAIHDQNIVAVFEHRYVLADLAETAERDDTQLFQLALRCISALCISLTEIDGDRYGGSHGGSYEVGRGF